jgi:cysteinyl-tRNA synthetase
MPIQLYDTLARAKRAFQPADPERVTLYVCGPTVYSYAHIGNARPAVVFDVLFRLLRREYGEGAVRYARNITDVDDKIIAASQEAGEPPQALTRRFEAIYDADMAALGCLPPTVAPRATEHMAGMIGVIEKLIANGKAYAADGHVLFDVAAFPDYGALSGRSTDDMLAGARVEVAEYKRSPADFVLWKPAKPGEPAWDSPWGSGRPGWHLECTAMIEAELGLPIDIHGGGHDLVFPHHENEIAQGRCAHDLPTYARYWMHNGFLTLGADKMSKSAGGTLLVHDLVRQTPGEVLRWALLSGHYRAPLDWTDELVAQSKRSLDRLYGALRRAAAVEDGPRVAPPPAFLEALGDDLNTPRATAELFALAKELETVAGPGRPAAKSALLAAGRVLGFLQADPEAWFEAGADPDLRERVDGLLAERAAARAAKDWAAADRIRAELTALHIEVMDGPEGATWRVKEPA